MIKTFGCLCASLLLLVSWPLVCLADTPLHVDITQGAASPLLIAIPEVASGPLPGVGLEGDPGVALSQVMRNDLSGTGLYRLVGEHLGVSGGAEVNFAPWQAINAQALLVGRASVSANGQLAFECSLYDVFAGKSELSHYIVVPGRDWRRAAHKCADLVFEQTTGDPGHFDTRIAYVQESGAKVRRVKRLAIMDYDGANTIFLTKGIELIAMPRYSPDGHFIAYMTYVHREPRITVYDLISGNTRTLDLPTGTIFSPRFSPDGKRLAFSLGNEGETDIYEAELATGAVARLTAAPGINTSPSYSPDGSRIVFESSRSGGQQIYVMARDGSKQTRISFGGGRYGSPTWSPRGDLIAYTRVGAEGFRIGVMRPDGSRDRLLTDDWQDESPSWAPSGRAIAFLRTRRGDALPELWTTDITGRVQRRIVLTAGGSDPDWSGRRP